MKQILILAVGKLKEPHLREACAEYWQRCSRTCSIVEKEVRDLPALVRAIPSREPLIVLDEKGEQMTSREFARHLRIWLERSASRVAFAIGGADGFTAEIRQRADCVLSFGPMTFAHRLVRLILAEQLYRAVSILEGAPYHRD